MSDAEKIDLIGLLDLVRDNAPAGRSLRVTIRRLPSTRGEKSITVTSFHAEKDDELLEKLNEDIERHGESGDYEIRIREKDPMGFDQSCTDRRSFAPRVANPLPSPGASTPSKDRLSQLAEALLERKLSKLFEDDEEEEEDDEGEDDDEEQELDDDDEDADAREENPSSPVGGLGDFLKDESFKMGIGRILSGFGEFVEARVEKARAEAEAAKKPARGTHDARVIQATIHPIKPPGGAA